MTDISPRVNGARMNDYVGQTVRLMCKVIKVPAFSFSPSRTDLIIDQVTANTAVVEATDGASVEVAVTPARKPLASLS
jgi:hypothetical protein